ERDAGLIDVDAFKRSREAVRVALAANFAVGDNVEPSVLLRLDREHGRIVLRPGKIRFRDAPKLFRPNARRKAASELGSIDEPFGLRVGPDQRRWQKHGLPSLGKYAWREGAILTASSLPGKASAGAIARREGRSTPGGRGLSLARDLKRVLKRASEP